MNVMNIIFNGYHATEKDYYNLLQTWASSRYLGVRSHRKLVVLSALWCVLKGVILTAFNTANGGHLDEPSVPGSNYMPNVKQTHQVFHRAALNNICNKDLSAPV